MKKELLISAKFDTSGFDRSVEQIQRKLKEIYADPNIMRAQTQASQRLQGIGMGGIMTPASMDAYKRSTQQSRRELDQIIKEQA